MISGAAFGWRSAAQPAEHPGLQRQREALSVWKPLLGALRGRLIDVLTLPALVQHVEFGGNLLFVPRRSSLPIAPKQIGVFHTRS